jgi:predicted amidohydrolase YtcJ
MKKISLLTTLFVMFPACAVISQPAQLIVINAKVWTGTPSPEIAQAVAVRDGRILHVGTTAEVKRLEGPLTKTIDAQGRLLVPGFIDDHTHFISGGFALASVDLRPARTPSEFSALLRDHARKLPNGRWITEGNWDHEAWPGAPLPRREWIDSVTPNHPVAVSRLDGHMLIANSVALKIAGITKDTPDPAGGTIVRDERTGEPTGVLKDEAMGLVFRHVPAPSVAERDEALRTAQAHALARGVTMINDMGSWPDLMAFRRARANGLLKIRVYEFVSIDSWSRLRDYMAREGTGDAQLKWGGLKGFVDGSLGSTTAWFYAPYNDEPNTSGLMVTDTAKLREWIVNADRANLHVAVHAIGERANDWLLDVYEWSARQNGSRDRRFRIEHAQHLTRKAISRFADLGVYASMQPYHAIDDGRWAEKRIGPERIKTTYAFRSLIDQKAQLMFGSDWTVAPIEPLFGIYAAVTRRTLDDANPSGWVAQEKISVAEALRAYTSTNARGAFMENEVGVLRAGMRADMVLLSDDILTIDPVRIRDAKVDYTIIDGVVVFTRALNGGT